MEYEDKLLEKWLTSPDFSIFVIDSHNSYSKTIKNIGGVSMTQEKEPNWVEEAQQLKKPEDFERNKLDWFEPTTGTFKFKSNACNFSR